MKKLISILLVLTLCLGLFVGCNNNKTPTTGSDLDAAKRILFNQYNTASKDEENKILADKELSTVVIVGGVSYSVEWKINMTSGDNGAVVITESETSNYVTLDVVNQNAESHYDLIATIKDSEGNSVSMTLKCYTPAVQKIELDDSKIILVLGGKYVTGEDYLYTSSSGSTKHELAMSENKSDALQLTVRENSDGTVTFVTNDGKFLMADGTNVQIVDAEGENTKFVLEPAEGGQYIKCASATYNGNAQYLEVYDGYLTCYGKSSTADVTIYTFVMEKISTVSAKEVLDAAYALEAGQSLEGGPFTLTGEITKIDTAWSDDYKNITVTIKVDDDGRTIQCFRLQGTGAKDLKVGDNITVEGTISNFNGTVQFDKACTLKKNNSNVHVHTEEVIPAKDATCTEDGLTEGKKCSECGAIIVAQQTIAAAHTWGEWEVTKKPTVSEDGERKHTCSVCNTTETEAVKYAATEWVVVETPEAGKAYKFALNQATLKKVLYFTGKMNGYYLATSDNTDDAVDMYLEAVEGGYRMYFMAGETKTYIDIVERDGEENKGKVNVKLVTEPTCVWTLNETLHIFTTTVAEKEWYLGTYDQMNDDGTVKKSLETISASEIKYITGDNASKLGVHQFVAQMYIEQEISDIVTAPKADTAYNVALNQATLEKVLYFTGKMNGYYLATSDNAADAVKVYVETVEGGYRMYFMAGETKTYIDIVERDGEENKGKVNVKLVTEPTCVWTWNKTLNIFTTTVAEKEWYLGTYDQMNDDGTVKKSLETISASEIKYITGDNASKLGVHQFVAQLYVIKSEDTVPPAGEDTNKGISISFAEKENRVSLDTESQVWQSNGITVTNAKANSTTNVADYSNPVRFYKDSSLKIECKGMTKIVIDCNKGKDQGGKALVESIGTMEGVTATCDGLVVTITFAEAKDVLEIAALTAQVRVDTITVYTA